MDTVVWMMTDTVDDNKQCVNRSKHRGVDDNILPVYHTQGVTDNVVCMITNTVWMIKGTLFCVL